MIKLLLTNLNILLKLNYYNKTIIEKFKYFIERSNYYHITIIDKFKYFIKIKLL
jgi:hypothetical protein